MRDDAPFPKGLLSRCLALLPTPQVASGNGATAAPPGVEAMNKAIGTKIRQAADDFATTQTSRGHSLIGRFVGAAARQHAEGRLQLKGTPKAAASKPASPTTPKKLEL